MSGALLAGAGPVAPAPDRPRWRPDRVWTGVAVLVGAAALGVLLLAASGRALPMPVVVLAVAVVAGAAAAWWWLDRRSDDGTTGIPFRVAVGLCVGAAALAALFAGGVLANRSALFGAAFCLYVGGGELISRWRRRTGLPALDGLLVGLSAAALATWGYLSLSPDSVAQATWLLVAAAGLAPLAVTLLSEAALRRLDRLRLPRRVLGRLLAAAALLPVTVVVGAMVVTDTDGLVLVAAGVGVVLTFLLVSRSPADLGLVVVALATVIALTEAPVEEPAELRPTRGEPTLVALGDSYMSGEGAATFFDGTDRPSTADDEKNQCRRSPSAYAVELATAPGAPFDQVAFVACSGARAAQLWRDVQYTGEPAGVPGGLPQLENLRRQQEARGFVPEVVLVSIGGNDSGFSTIGITCGGPGDCTDIERYWLGNLPQVGRAVGQAYERIREAFPSTPVAVVPYPLPFPADGSCRSIWLTAAERRFVDGFARALNATIKQQAQRAGFYVIDDVQGALDDRPGQPSLQLCDRRTSEAGVNFVGLRSVSGATLTHALQPANWVHGSLHPNETGHDRIGDVVRSWLAEHPDLQVEAPAEPGAIGPPPASLPDPGCDVLDESERGCRALAMEWVKGEALRVAPLGMTAAAVAGAGTWLVVLLTLALWRRRRG